jgi:hypothetical protein
MPVIDTLQVVLDVVGDRAIAMLTMFEKRVTLARDSFNKFTKDITVQSQISSAAFLAGLGKVGDWLNNISPTFQAYGDVVSTTLKGGAETVASDVSPAMDTATTAVGGVVQAYQDLDPAVRQPISAMIALTVAAAALGAAWVLLGPLIAPLGVLFGGLLTGLTGVSGGFGALVVASGGLLPALVAIAVPVAAIIAVVALLWTAWERDWGNIREWAAVAIDAIKGILDGFVNVIKGVLDIINGIISLDGDKIWKGVTEVFGGAVEIAQNIFIKLPMAILGFLANLLGGVINWGIELGGKIREAFDKIVSGAVSFGGQFVNSIISGISGLAGALGNAIWNLIPEPFRGMLQGAASFVGGIAGGVVRSVSSYIPHFQEGGIVTRPTLAMVGEAGPEAIVPVGAGGGGGLNIGTLNIVNPVLKNDADIRDTARKVAVYLHQEFAAQKGAMGWSR